MRVDPARQQEGVTANPAEAPAAVTATATVTPAVERLLLQRHLRSMAGMIAAVVVVVQTVMLMVVTRAMMAVAGVLHQHQC